MCYKYNIVLELAKFENPFLALILSNKAPDLNGFTPSAAGLAALLVKRHAYGHPLTGLNNAFHRGNKLYRCSSDAWVIQGSPALKKGLPYCNRLYKLPAAATFLLLLFIIQTAVIAIARQQICMPDLLYYFAFNQHQDIIKIK